MSGRISRREERCCRKGPKGNKKKKEEREAKNAKDAKRDHVEGTSAEQPDVTMADGATPEVAAVNGAATGAPEAVLVKAEADTPKVETLEAKTHKAEPKVVVKVDTAKASTGHRVGIRKCSITDHTFAFVWKLGRCILFTQTSTPCSDLGVLSSRSAS